MAEDIKKDTTNTIKDENVNNEENIQGNKVENGIEKKDDNKPIENNEIKWNVNTDFSKFEIKPDSTTQRAFNCIMNSNSTFKDFHNSMNESIKLNENFTQGNTSYYKMDKIENFNNNPQNLIDTAQVYGNLKNINKSLNRDYRPFQEIQLSTEEFNSINSNEYLSFNVLNGENELIENVKVLKTLSNDFTVDNYLRGSSRLYLWLKNYMYIFKKAEKYYSDEFNKTNDKIDGYLYIWFRFIFKHLQDFNSKDLSELNNIPDFNERNILEILLLYNNIYKNMTGNQNKNCINLLRNKNGQQKKLNQQIQQNQYFQQISPITEEMKEEKENEFKYLYKRIVKVTIDYMKSVYDFNNVKKQQINKLNLVFNTVKKVANNYYQNQTNLYNNYQNLTKIINYIGENNSINQTMFSSFQFIKQKIEEIIKGNNINNSNFEQINRSLNKLSNACNQESMNLRSQDQLHNREIGILYNMVKEVQSLLTFIAQSDDPEQIANIFKNYHDVLTNVRNGGLPTSQFKQVENMILGNNRNLIQEITRNLNLLKNEQSIKDENLKKELINEIGKETNLLKTKLDNYYGECNKKIEILNEAVKEIEKVKKDLEDIRNNNIECLHKDIESLKKENETIKNNFFQVKQRLEEEYEEKCKSLLKLINEVKTIKRDLKDIRKDDRINGIILKQSSPLPEINEYEDRKTILESITSSLNEKKINQDISTKIQLNKIKIGEELYESEEIIKMEIKEEDYKNYIGEILIDNLDLDIYLEGCLKLIENVKGNEVSNEKKIRTLIEYMYQILKLINNYNIVIENETKDYLFKKCIELLNKENIEENDFNELLEEFKGYIEIFIEDIKNKLKHGREVFRTDIKYSIKGKDNYETKKFKNIIDYIIRQYNKSEKNEQITRTVFTKIFNECSTILQEDMYPIYQILQKEGILENKKLKLPYKGLFILIKWISEYFNENLKEIKEEIKEEDKKEVEDNKENGEEIEEDNKRRRITEKNIINNGNGTILKTK